MDATTITNATFTIQGPGVTSVLGIVTYDATNRIAIFSPTALLPAGTVFTATITTGARSAGGVALASNFVWTFVTSAGSDTTKPTVIVANPANLAINVPINHKITATFSQPMDSTTITGSTFTLTGPGLTPVAGTVTYSMVGVTATFTPSSPLAATVLYTATITTGAQDLAGNPLKATFTWTFSTGSSPDVTPPTITSTTPANGDTLQPPNTSISATFNEAIDVSTVDQATFALTGPGPTSIDGKITYDAVNQIVTFTPTSLLATSSLFTATIKAATKDLRGIALAADFSWSFTTGTTSSLLPVDLGAATGFEVLASSTITNSGATEISGDLGLTPGTSVTGFPPGIVDGTIEINSAPATAARAALMTAFGDAAGRTGATLVAENLAGLTLPPGLYTSAATSFEITGGNLTLDALGDANAVWIFQMPASTLTLTTPSCDVILANGAKAANIFWQVGSSATIGVGCTMKGTVLASASVTMASGSSLDGRALAGESAGAVTLGTNSVSAPGSCSQ